MILTAKLGRAAFRWVKIYVVFLFCWALQSSSAMAQAEQPDFYYLKVEAADSARVLLKTYLPREVFFDTTDLTQSLATSAEKIRKEGYWLASFDHRVQHKDSVTVHFYLGRKYSDCPLDISDLKTQRFPFLSKKDFTKPTWEMKELQNMEKRILEYAQNHGYPFASTQLQPFKSNRDSIRLKLSYTENSLVLFDSVEIIADSINIKPSFLKKKIGIIKGSPFSQLATNQAHQTLDKLPFLKADAPVTTFEDDNAHIQFSLKKEKANEVDGVLGFFPRQGNRGGVQLAGNFDLHLYNLFASGKELQFSWQRFQNQSQVLDAAYTHPYLLGTRLDIALALRFLQQDSTFSSAQRTLLFGYDLRDKGYFQLFAEWLSHQTGNRIQEIGSDTNLSEAVVSGSYISYGFKYLFDGIDRFQTFSRGHLIELKAQVGNKKIDADTLTNVVVSSGLQTQIQLRLSKHIRLGKINTLKFRNTFALLASKNRFRNEFFRIGGLQTLRGFNENAIFSSTHNITSVELLSQFSSIAFFPFIDYARWQEGTKGLPIKGLGTGLGINISTKSGLFSIIYALGQRERNPLKLNEAKIHFGFTNKF